MCESPAPLSALERNRHGQSGDHRAVPFPGKCGHVYGMWWGKTVPPGRHLSTYHGPEQGANSGSSCIIPRQQAATRLAQFRYLLIWHCLFPLYNTAVQSASD